MTLAMVIKTGSLRGRECTKCHGDPSRAVRYSCGRMQSDGVSAEELHRDDFCLGNVVQGSKYILHI